MKFLRYFLGIALIIFGFWYNYDPSINDAGCKYIGTEYCGREWSWGERFLILGSLIGGILIMIGWGRIRNYLSNILEKLES